MGLIADGFVVLPNEELHLDLLEDYGLKAFVDQLANLAFAVNQEVEGFLGDLEGFFGVRVAEVGQTQNELEVLEYVTVALAARYANVGAEVEVVTFPELALHGCFYLSV